MNDSCLLMIKNKYDLLTNAEKRIAEFILKNSEAVIKMSAEKLAENAQTAKSAVVRCCKSLGFDGYSSLKLALAVDLSKNKQFNYVPYIYPHDSTGDILDKVFSSNVKTLHDTAQKLDRACLHQVVELLSKSHMIYIYGMGTSSAIVNDFQYRLMQLGYNAVSYTDVPSMKISTLNIKKGDVAVGISHSGRTVATVEVLELAKAAGAETVCITSYPNSQITKVSDYSIEVFSDEIQYPMEAISARIAHMSIIDTIAVALSAKDYENAFERSAKTYELINTVRYKKN